MTGFPGNYSIVGYHFTYISESIVQRNELVLNELTSYVPSFQIVLSISSYLYKVDSYSLSWFLVFVIYVFYILGIYAFLREVRIESKIAFVVCLISTLIIVWDKHYFAPPIHDVQPRTLALVMLPYALIFAVKMFMKKPSIRGLIFKVLMLFLITFINFLVIRNMVHPELVDRRLLIIPVGVTLLTPMIITKFVDRSISYNMFGYAMLLLSYPIIHTFEGLIYVIIITVFMLNLLLVDKKCTVVNIVNTFSILIIFTVLQLIDKGVVIVPREISINIPYITYTTLPLGYIYRPERYFEVLKEVVTEPVLYFTIAVILLRSLPKMICCHSEDRIFSSATSTFILALLIYFLPIKDIVRAIAVLSPFIAYFVSMGITNLTSIVANHNIVNNIAIKRRNHTIPLSSFVKYTFVLFLILSATTVYVSYINDKISKAGTLSLISDYEYEAALYIRNTTPRNAVIISDPETIFIISGISGRKIPIKRGMLVESLQFEDLIVLYWIKHNIFLTNNPAENEFYLRLIGGCHPIVVLSTRTVKWLEQRHFQFVRKPQEDNVELLKRLAEKLTTFRHLKLIKEIDSKIYVFTLNTACTGPNVAYDIFIINNYSRYGNITKFANDWRNSSREWFLVKDIRSGLVRTIVYEQYISNRGYAPVILWKIPLPKNYTYVSVYVYNRRPTNVDPRSYFSFSFDGVNWVNGNFSEPLIYIFDVEPKDKILVLYGRALPGKFNRLGSFIFVGWYYGDRQ